MSPEYWVVFYFSDHELQDGQDFMAKITLLTKNYTNKKNKDIGKFDSDQICSKV